MAFQHGRSTAVLLGQYNVSAYCDNVDAAGTLDPGETTVFGATAKSYIPGLRDGTVSLTGKADYGSGAIDDVLAAAVDGTQKVTTIAYGGLTIGNRARVALTRQTNYQQSAPVGDVVNWSADLQCDGGLDQNAVVLAAAEVFTGVANLASVDGGAATTNGFACNVHVTAVDTLTSATVKPQHSTDDVTFADLATSSSITAVGAQQLTGTGTVNRYTRLRCSAITGTSATVTAALARR